MKLEEIIKGITVSEIIGNTTKEISGINIDSRLIEPEHVFVAVKGTQTDGHAYITKAIEKGAVAVVCETLPETLNENITYIKVGDTEDIVGKLATAFYGDPTSKLELVGVTGTNGKTTIATLLYNMFRKFGYKVGLISTVCNYIDDEAVSTDHTTPDPITLNQLLGRMADEGCKYVFMEVSSHAIHQKRIAGLDFDGAIFSNITHDHLDYHKTFKAYIEAKKAFFDNLKKDAFALTNADDKNGRMMLQNTAACKYTYSCRTLADFNARAIEKQLDGTLLQLDGQEVWTKFTGDFNAYNLLAVYATACLLGLEKEEILRCMSMLVPVSGRFETLLSPEGVVAIVDYAHTPDAIENVLSTIKGLKGKNNKVITVVGAGGDRDKTKRPEMAEAACRWSDRIILTSDNPRSEEPTAIIADMQAGVREEYRRNVLAIPDRREAIRTALLLASKGDIVLVAGKGHENYQEIKGVKHHFDDKEVVREIFGL